MYIGDNLKQLRLQNSKERKEVADDTNTVRETYRRYENNQRKTPLDKRKQFAAYFKVSLQELETGIAPEQAQTPPAQKVHEQCKLIAAIKDINDIKKEMVLALAQSALDWLGKGK